MADAKTGGYVRPELLAETDWLLERLDDPNVRIIDCRDDPSTYDTSHIPGAVYMNYKATKTKDGGLHVLTIEEAKRTFGDLGIGDDNDVIVYDDIGSYAGRIWWTLFHLGHQKVRILNGGWKKWAAEGKPVTREIPRPQPATFTPRPREDDIATADEVMSKIDDPNTIIFDTRSGVEYFGILERLGYHKRARRGGHIPSARWVNWTRSIESDHTMKPAAELEKMFREEGFDPNKETIVYCQSAARSGHQLFTLKLLGYDNVRNYDGSWKEWGNSDRVIQVKPMPSKATAGALTLSGAALLGVTAATRAASRTVRRRRG